MDRLRKGMGSAVVQGQILTLFLSLNHLAESIQSGANYIGDAGPEQPLWDSMGLMLALLHPWRGPAIVWESV